MLYGSIEAGGTKFVCAVGDENFNVVDQTQFPTTTPDETLARTVKYFKKFDHIDAFGIASFGPIDIDKNSDTYGWIIKTPKKGWSNIDFLGKMKESFHVPMFWTTDVNGSAYGEYVSAKRHDENIKSVSYITIGTGIGMGSVINGDFLGVKGTPEFGHIKVKRHRDDLDFKGTCPWHGDCLEGVASGPTFEARNGVKGQDTPISDPTWDIIAYYAAQAVVDLTVTFRPDKVVLGGGVCTPEFIDKVRAQFTLIFNNYLSVGSLEKYITGPEIQHNGSATFGDFVLAQKAIDDEKKNIEVGE
ncbi:ROK family protein [Fructilactobacillus carniphilus]|uniref:fructokinase n=1 Tax=Fructilactobacillus carniphilus TaxID=2940297 RepID=A0ABY5C1X9_9LACO|nr:ROK family protein [Fructilactobacillus carniphilus]USS91321.1 ROK family protein [Fructilactobacillus carniphilus]